MFQVYIENTYIVLPYIKKSNGVGRIDNFRALASDLLTFITSNTDKHEFSSIWKWIRCCNDVMNNVDCVIKLDFYPQKMHSCSKNIMGYQFLF